jgi:hypothetical protein
MIPRGDATEQCARLLAGAGCAPRTRPAVKHPNRGRRRNGKKSEQETAAEGRRALPFFCHGHVLKINAIKTTRYMVSMASRSRGFSATPAEKRA